MRVALYARVSSYKQAEKDLPISGQLKAMKEYALRQSYTVLESNIYVDEARSALSDNRPAFKKMVDAAKASPKPFEAILVWKFSRFARNREDSILYKAALKKKGVHVISINEPVDDSPAGMLLEGIIEVIDEFYSVNLAQDTMRGMRESASRGYWTCGRYPYGYQGIKIEEGSAKRTKLILGDDSPVIARMFRMCLEGYGAKEIATTLNKEGVRTRAGHLWSHKAVLSILRNEIYTGAMVWNRREEKRSHRKKDEKEIIRVAESHPAIVDAETFRKVQQALDSRGPDITSPRALSSHYLLSGLVQCGECGHHMAGASAKSNQYFYYACQSYVKRGKLACQAKLVSKEHLEGKVLERIQRVILREGHLEKLNRMVLEELSSHKGEHEQVIGTIEAQLKELGRKLSKLYDAVEGGKLSIDDLAPRIKETRSQVEELELRQLELQESLKNGNVKPIPKEAIREMVSDLQGVLNNGTFRERRAFIRSWVKGIKIKRQRVTIEYAWPSSEDGGNGRVLSLCTLSWERGIRTPTSRSRACCPTIRRSPKVFSS